MHNVDSFAIAPIVFEAVPAFRRLILVAEVVGDPQAETVELALEDARRVAAGALDRAGGVAGVASVLAWRSAFRSVGIDPSAYRPAVEALLRRVEKGQPVRLENALVNAGTAISLRFQVPVGVHVLDGLAGELRLGPAVGIEHFVSLAGAQDDPERGELIWGVGNDVLTRRWAWRQGAVGSVTETSRDLAVNVDMLDDRFDAVESVAGAMTELLFRCGVRVRRTLLLDAAHPKWVLDGHRSPQPPHAPLLAELDERGLLADCTDRDALAARMLQAPITLYCGIDPTADSLHVGSLLPLATLRRFQQSGHRPIVVIGGATGSIGDPSGRRAERPLLDDDTLDANRSALLAQVERLLPEASGCPAPLVVDNRDWTVGLGILDFLRDVGRHARVGEMLAHDSVRPRLSSEEGISFAEFTYSLLQALDFDVLARVEGCCLQVGGSDQWGNIVAGIDLIRRRSGADAFGLTWPLLLRADGEKFGKTAEGNVWLDAKRTSPWQFWQFWLNTSDDDVATLLRRFSVRPLADIDGLLSVHAAEPGRRLAQRALADELCTWVHGESALPTIHRVAAGLFGGEDIDLSDDHLLALLRAEVATTIVAPEDVEGEDVTWLVVLAGFASSRGAAARLILGGGVHVTSGLIERPSMPAVELVAQGACLLRRGRRTHHLIVVEGQGPEAPLDAAPILLADSAT